MGRAAPAIVVTFNTQAAIIVVAVTLAYIVAAFTWLAASPYRQAGSLWGCVLDGLCGAYHIGIALTGAYLVGAMIRNHYRTSTAPASGEK